jgi:hypothetical protein
MLYSDSTLEGLENMSNNSTDSSFDKTEGEQYLTALLYNSEEASKYISERIGVPLEKARSFVNACNEYEILLGIVPIDDEDDAKKNYSSTD